MRILDRYIFRSIFNLYFGCLISFIFLYVVIDIFSHLDDFLKLQQNAWILKDYYLSYLPVIFTQVSPISCLLATLYTFGKLNRDNEIIAMRASGLNIFQVTKTAIIFGLVISIAMFWVYNKIAPLSLSLNQNVKLEMDSYAENNPKKAKQKQEEKITGLSMYGHKNRLFFINTFYPARNTIEGIIVLQHNQKQNISKKIVANKGVYKDGLWRFYHVVTYSYDDLGQISKEPTFEEEEIMDITETPRDFLTQRERPDFMTTAELEKYIWKLSGSGAKTVIQNLQVDLYQRFTMPFTNLIIIFLGIPFAFMMRRRAAGLSSLGISLFVGFLYYVAIAVSTAFGKGGVLNPFLSASLSHLLALSTGLYLISTLP